MRGRPRKPAALRLLQGNTGHRQVTFGPKFKDGFGSCPKHLAGEARKLWRQLAKELDEKGLSARVFRPMLEGLCYWYGEWRRCAQIVMELGETVETADGPRPRAEVRMGEAAYSLFRSCCQEFGLTPASNGKVTVPKSKKESLRDELLRRGSS